MRLGLVLVPLWVRQGPVRRLSVRMVASFERDAMGSVEFVGSFRTIADMPKDHRLPEVAFFGRSNVGKSSALNCLTGRHKKKLARVSKTPGCTTALNLYTVGKSCAIVDLPGYGYAKRGQELQQAWGRAITDYVEQRTQLRAMVVFLDPRHGPTDADANLLAWLREFGVDEEDILPVATKVDLLKPGEVAKKLQELEEAYAVSSIIHFSSQSHAGRAEVWRAIEQRCRGDGR